jgi:NAD(P)-dependent dehydrogenase (short-subunit alcohol dehydrogenase family)
MSAPSGVIVTGGTGALGRTVVRLLLERGARVAVPWRRAEEWRALESELGSPASLFGAPADLADPAAARGFVDAAASRLGELDGLALAAGTWAGGTRFEEAPEDEWDRMMRTNLMTVRNVCRAALPRLAARSSGSVVAVGARAAEVDGASMAAYAVSKAALHALVRVLALENRGRGVRVNAVLPGTIDTPANRRAMPKADPSAWTSPAAIAEVVVFLLSPDSAPVTGALVPVDAPG